MANRLTSRDIFLKIRIYSMGKSRTPLLDSLDAYQAAEVLRMLLHDDPDLLERVEAYSRRILERLDQEQIAEEITDAVCAIEDEDVWERAGRQEDGSYLYPGEAAYEMVEEILDAHLAEVKKYIRRGMPDPGREYCQGIILGFWRLENGIVGVRSDELDECMIGFIQDVREMWEREAGDPAQIRLLLDWMEEEGIPA